VALTCQQPDWVLGFADEVWFSRLSQPALHAWTPQKPLRLCQKEAVPADVEPKALACYGLWLPEGSKMLLRFVDGRPVSTITCAFLSWIARRLAEQGKKVLRLIWDNASWHTSQIVRDWIRAHNPQVKQEGGCRLIVFRLPVKSLWLNNIEPKWVHGKRAVVEPERTLSRQELMERLCAYYGCQHEPHLSKENA
jgi:DDE superfamily endonuclease